MSNNIWFLWFAILLLFVYQCSTKNIGPYGLLFLKILVHTDFLGAVLVVIVWLLDLLLPVQSVHITTKVEILNPTHGKVYSVQHYVIMILSDLW
jgi:hypothetical protein